MQQLRLSQLSFDELQRVHSTLSRRYDVGLRSKILQIAFGLAEHAGVADPRRGASICFYVREKQPSENLANEQRIESPIRVRIKRGEKFFELIAPADVIELDTDNVQLTGLPIRYTNLTSGTTGILLAWRRPERHRLAWGVLTVGHIFPSRLSLPDEQVNVEISTSHNQTLPARLVARADHVQLDASLSIVRRQDLVDAQLITSDTRARGRVFKTKQQLVASTGRHSNIRHNKIRQGHGNGRRGHSMPRNQRHPFHYARFLVEAPIFQPLLGFAPRNVLHAVADESLFRPGTSGSPWSIGRLAAGMQFASLHPGYRQGFGQTLDDILPWARSAIASLNRLRPQQIDLRFIRYF